MLGNRHGVRVLELLLVVCAGCANHDVTVPAACLDGPVPIRSALKQAPGDVRIQGKVKISGCFKGAANAADVQNVGSSFLAATEDLTQRVRREPRSHAAVELGYLLGAVRRGAGTDGGVHYESERRIEQELHGAPTSTPQFRQGLAAGRRSG